MRRAVALAALVGAVIVAGPAPGAQAHPLGNFTVNRYSGLRFDLERVAITYVLDLAEIPAFQELERIDVDGDGAASDAELAGWAAAEADNIAAGLSLSVEGRAVTLAVERASAEPVAGQAGLDTLRLEALVAGDLPQEGAFIYEDGNEDGRLGWREVTAIGVDGVGLEGSTVPAESTSDELRAYPKAALASPPDVSIASGTFAPGVGGATTGAPSAAATERAAVDGVPFASVLTNEGLPLIALGLVIAIAFGAWHALLPGHGKTLMAAAMVGGGARGRSAAAIAAAVALLHTASVLALGFAVLALERTFRPEALYPWLGALSGLAAVGIGAHLVRSRWATWRHLRAHDHHHDLEHGVALTSAGALSGRGIVALAFAGGILPAPSALIAMLAAIQLHRVAYGLALVLAFSVGLAAALLAVGLGALKARDALAERASSRIAALVPLVSALAIVIAGAVIAARSVAAV